MSRFYVLQYPFYKIDLISNILNLSYIYLYIDIKDILYLNLLCSKLFYKNIFWTKYTTIKTKSTVNYSKHKLRPQKGLGKARLNTKASPLCKGGGISFGPLPQLINIRLNKKEVLLLKTLLLFNKRSNLIFLNISFLSNIYPFTYVDIISKYFGIMNNTSLFIKYSDKFINIKNLLKKCTILDYIKSIYIIIYI